MPETRRVLDQFAERKGDRTWQTPITLQGLNTLRKLLKKTARRNTAVACHWVRSKNYTELLWIVGNQRKFNIDGTVPTNITQRNILRSEDENSWNTAEDMALLAGIAALFHDIGKANKLFQQKIDPEVVTNNSEPYRHEWVSLKLFLAFVGDLNDQQWLEKLSTVKPSDDKSLLQALKAQLPENNKVSPFKQFEQPLAQAVGWLILTHHKLPFVKAERGETVKVSKANSHLKNKLTARWNSPQINNADWTKTQLTQVWQFSLGTSLKSEKWCRKARILASRALKRQSFYQQSTNWLDDKYTLHLSRLALMLADHHYSSMPANKFDQDSKYKVYANSDRETGQLKQKLDEHLIGVYKHSLRFVRMLPSLKPSLPAISDIKTLKRRNKLSQFQWQDRAYDVAKLISTDTEQQGFFGVNMASTGRGKTLANAKIMYGLSNSRDGCRFSVALGLRTLTLQTGEALKQRLALADDDLAVLIGSQAVKQLYDLDKEQKDQSDKTDKLNTGSESENELLDEDQYVQYQGVLVDGVLQQWLANKPKLHKLVSAPILVSTIDHLMPATEGARGGKQIAPMLRLLTSDLVLDEPDDFDIADMPALCRLVNWAGVLGSRVLLSSATLPPSALEALFASYLEGRSHFNKARGINNKAGVVCAWFDEFSTTSQNCIGQQEFSTEHQSFVSKRSGKLRKQPGLHKALLSNPIPASNNGQEAIWALSQEILTNACRLHQEHKQEIRQGTYVSLGLVRMANINPLVAVAKQLFVAQPIENTHIHLCIYHSQFPLIVRSKIENTLDSVLDRTDKKALSKHPEIVAGLKCSPAKNHIFIVLASPVIETGRDLDFDWAIAEPSSMRSIIQLAGRVQRHRREPATSANIVLLNNNYKSLVLKGKPAFCRPGFETETFKLKQHQLKDVLIEEQYQHITAIPRISQAPKLNWQNNLVDLEHYHLQQALFDKAGKEGAYHWWDKACHLTYQLQSHTPFRASSPSNDYYLRITEDEQGYQQDIIRWYQNGEAKEVNSEFSIEQFEPSKHVSLWAVQDYTTLLTELSEKLEQSTEYSSAVFGAINLRESKHNWNYSNEFGFYQEI